MDNEYGIQMNAALRAVLRMHRDSSKLLQDLDRALPSFKSLLGSFVTKDLSYDIKAGRYMAEGLHRLYARDKETTEILAVNLCFIDTKKNFFKCPTLIAAHLSYKIPALTPQDIGKRAWDPWTIFVATPEPIPFRTIISRDYSLDSVSLNSARLQAAPLFDFTTSSQVLSFLSEVSPDGLLDLQAAEVA